MDIDKTYDDILERYQERRKLRNKINQYKLRKEGRRKGRSERADARWITVGAKEPTNKDPGSKGRHVLIDDEGEVISGAGGSLTGVKLGGAKSTSGEVKVDPKKVKDAPESGGKGEVKGGAIKPEEPKEKYLGDYEKNPEHEKAISELNEELKGAVIDDPYTHKKVVSDSVAMKAGLKIPEGTVFELNGETYVKYASGYSSGFIKIGDTGWDGTVSPYGKMMKATSGLKYLGSVDLAKTKPEGLKKEIAFEGNYAKEITKKLWDEAKKNITCQPGFWAKNFDIVKSMDKMPKGSEIEFDDGTILKRYLNDWRIKNPGETAFSKMYGLNSLFAQALMRGTVKSIKADVSTKAGEDVSVDNPFVARFGSDYEPMHEIVSASKGAEGKLWKKYENKMVIEKKGKSDCYHSGSWRITLSSLKGPKGYHPYSVAFHEGAHLIDDRMGHALSGEKATMTLTGEFTTPKISELYEHGKLRKTMTEEWKEAKEKLAGQFAEKAKELATSTSLGTLFYSGYIDYNDYNKFSKEESKDELPAAIMKTTGAGKMLAAVTGKTWDAYGDVLDMFCMASRGKFGSGHAKSYASSSMHTSTEFFAEAFSAKMCNPESLKLIKTYFPKSYEVFEEILSWAEKNM